MAEASSQTYTFLFTDIEGSTRLWEQFPEAMHDVLAQHDEILRRCIQSNGGHVFKTVGDAFCAAFNSPHDALEAIAAAQLSIRRHDFSPVEDLKVRAAVYTGDARQRDNDFFGTALNRVARLLSAGYGGQTLFSAATYELVRDRLPKGFGSIDLGPHQLRDLEYAENIHQLTHPDLPSEFPRIRSIEAYPNNLPRELSTFVGREREVQEVRQMLKHSALLTLIGAGGCGKTRLALQVAQEDAHQYDDGVWLVELAPITDPALLPRTIAGAMNISEEQGQPMVESLKKQLRSQSLLIVLDNCEHLVGACAQIVDQLLRAAPKLKILATSREALGVPGETSWKVPSLSLPASSDLGAEELMETSEAARLFVERATNVLPTFSVTNANASSLAAICLRLDGIPLALELAAARVKALPIEQIATRLDDRFRLLTGGSRTALPRQQTLRAAIDWSYNLLSTGEKQLLCRLSVFSGGWTLEAAEAVCSGDGIEDWETLDLLTQIVDKSLAVFEEPSGEARYRMLETVRQYAREKLFDQFDATSLRRRHVQFFLDFAIRAEAELGGEAQALWLDRIEAEHDNCRAALEWSESDSEGVEECLRLAKALGRFWEIRGFYEEGAKWLRKALDIGPKDLDDLRMRALNQLGNILREQAEYSGARLAYEESLVLARKLGFRKGVAIVLNNLGTTHLNLGDLETSKRNYEESIEICRLDGYTVDMARALDNLGSLYGYLRDPVKARELHSEALPIFSEFKDDRSIAIALHSLADVDREEGHLDDARERFKESLRICHRLEFRSGIASSLEGLGHVCAMEGRFECGARMFGAAAALRERLGSPIPPQAVEAHVKSVATLCEAMGDESYRACYDEGHGMKLERFIESLLE